MSDTTAAEALKRVKEKLELMRPYFIDVVGHVIYQRQALNIIDAELKALEPVDTELEEAKKRFPVGSWFTVNHVGLSTLYKVDKVERSKYECLKNTIFIYTDKRTTQDVKNCTPSPLLISEPRDCVDDPPLKSGDYLVKKKTGQLYLISFNGIWYDYAEVKGDVWFELPKEDK